MSGIVFFRTEDLETVEKFYREKIGAFVWKDQGDCLIFQKLGLKFGFCQSENGSETCGIITFVYGSRDEVDQAYARNEKIARSPPVSRRPEFDIYQFFGEDPVPDRAQIKPPMLPLYHDLTICIQVTPPG